MCTRGNKNNDAVFTPDINMQHKRGTHFHGGDPTYFSFRAVPEEFIIGVEVAHIRALSPPENMYRESGRCHIDGFQQAVEQVWADALPAQTERIEAHYSRLAEQIAARL